MANIYQPQSGLDYCTQYVSNMPVSRIQTRMVQGVSQQIWDSMPWRWTLASLAAVTILANTKDYTISIPTDFQYIVQAYMTDGTTKVPLDIEGFLPSQNTQTGEVSTISLNGTTLRVDPIPGTQDRTWNIIITYKKTAPIIPRSDYSVPGILQMPDQWSYVFEEGLLWKTMTYAYDNRAGDISKDDKGNTKYSGQVAVFMAALEMMKESEKPLTAMTRMTPSLDRKIG